MPFSTVKSLRNFECSIRKCSNYSPFVKYKKTVINWMNALMNLNARKSFQHVNLYRKLIITELFVYGMTGKYQ